MEASRSDVFNGGGDIAYTRKIADEINGLAYHLGPVKKADRFEYTETAVYYPPGAEALAKRLGDSLCVNANPSRAARTARPPGRDRRPRSRQRR